MRAFLLAALVSGALAVLAGEITIFVAAVNAWGLMTGLGVGSILVPVFPVASLYFGVAHGVWLPTLLIFGGLAVAVPPAWLLHRRGEL